MFDITMLPALNATIEESRFLEIVGGKVGGRDVHVLLRNVPVPVSPKTYTSLFL